MLSFRTNEDVATGRPGRWAGATKDELAELDDIHAKGDWSVAGVSQQITNLDKVLMPGRKGEPPITKRDIIPTTRRSPHG